MSPLPIGLLQLVDDMREGSLSDKPCPSLALSRSEIYRLERIVWSGSELLSLLHASLENEGVDNVERLNPRQAGAVVNAVDLVLRSVEAIVNAVVDRSVDSGIEENAS